MVVGAVSSSALRGAPAWDVIVGDRFIAAVNAPAPQAVLSALAEAAGDPECAVERLVGLFPVGRTDAIGSFALVWWAPGAWSEVTAVVRGDAVVDLGSPGGSRRFDARGSRPWLLAEFHDVTAVRIAGAESALAPIGAAANPVTHARASVRASSIEWTAVAPKSTSSTSSPSSSSSVEPGEHAGHAEAGGRVDTGAIADTVLVRRSYADADTVITPMLPRDELEADTILTPRAPGRTPGIAPAAASFATDLDGLDGVRRPLGIQDGQAAVPPLETDAAASVTPAAPVPRSNLAADPATPGEPPTAEPAPAAAGEPATPATPATAIAPGRPGESTPPTGPRFRVGAGPERILTAPVLIGRRPTAPRVARVAGPEPELVVVDSPRSVVSSTHLELRLEGTRLVATDLRSTNGTTVRTAAGVRRLRAGESLVVTPGSSIDLGDDTIIEILPAHGTPID